MSMALAILTCMVAPAETKLETIQLRSGHTLVAEVLREKREVLIVDVGFDVLRIPKDDVASRSEGEKPTAAPGGGRSFGESGDLYATADLPIRPVKDLVDGFGEAVVVVRTPSGLGSGFIVDEKGHCVTNAHVVEGETRISVNIFPKGSVGVSERTVSDVRIVAVNPFYDLALLKIPRQKDIEFERAYFGFFEELRQGEQVFAIGSPQGLDRSVSQGIIGNVNRNFQGNIYIQTTAQINPGNSGGPLFNMRGQVIGVTNMKLIFSEGLGFAIPIHHVKEFLRNREAFAYDQDNPNTGYRYIDPPRRQDPADYEFEKP